MKKFVVFFALLGILSACQTNLETTSSDAQGKTLALKDGGFLSANNANDLDPFVFTSTNGESWIFFSSDRGGNYDIYYARMYEDEDGTFAPPAKLGININTTNDERCPIVVQNYDSITLYFLQNNIAYSIDLGTDLENITNTNLATGAGFPATSNIGLMMGSDPKFLLSSESKSIELPRLDSEPFSLSTPWKIYHASGYTNAYGNVYIVEIETNGKRQLAGGVSLIKTTNVLVSISITIEGNQLTYTNTNTFTNTNTKWFALPSYASSYNDITPFVDSAHSNKVYFASDRYGKNHYDLYRYNTDRYIEGAKQLQTLLTNSHPLDLTLTSPVNGSNYSSVPSIPITGSIANADSSNITLSVMYIGGYLWSLTNHQTNLNLILSASNFSNNIVITDLSGTYSFGFLAWDEKGNVSSITYITNVLIQ